MTSEGPATQWAEIIFLLSVAAVVYLVLLVLAFLCDFLGAPASGLEDLTDLRMSLLALRDSKLFVTIKEINDAYSIDAAFVRIFPSAAVCIVYVYNTYSQYVSPAAHIILASFGLFTLSSIALQIPIDPHPIRFVTQYEFAVEVLSCTSLIMSRGSTWLNFSFLQAHIVLNRFLDVLPTLTALFWKKPQPHLQQKIRFLAIFIVHVYIFASGLQLFERLGDPLQVFRSTSLELTLWNALYFTFVTVFTVGYGDFIPYTLLGRTWMILVIMVGVLLVSYKIAKFHELSLAFWSGQGSFVKRDGIQHCVICGNIKWEYLKAFVEEFYSDHENKKRELVVMSDAVAWSDQEWNKFFSPHTFYERQVSYYCGSCMSEEDLARAKVGTAEAVFVLNNQHNPNVYVEDSETLKRILTIRSYAPDVPIYSMCALTDSMFQIGYALEHASVNKEPLLSGSSDQSLLAEVESDGMVVPFFEGPTGPKSEAICMQDLEMSMLAGNVYCNGMSTLLSNLLLFTKPAIKEEDQEQPWMMEYKTGTENCFQFVKIPSQMHETMYREIALTLYDHGVVLLATKTYFDVEWKPISPDTPLSHSSIGLVLTYLAPIDLSSVLDNIAENVVAESTIQSETESFPLMDEMSHRTPSWHEIAGRRLTGDGPNSVTYLQDDYDEIGEYDEVGEFDGHTVEEDEDADDEQDGILDDDDSFFQTPQYSEEPASMRLSGLPFYASPPSAHDQTPVHIPSAFNDGTITSANDNPEEFSRADGESESGDGALSFGNDREFDIPDVLQVDSCEVTDTDTPVPADNTVWRAASSSQHRSVLRNAPVDDGPPSKGSDGARVTFKFGTRSSGDERSGTGSPNRRPRRSIFKHFLGGSTFPSRPTNPFSGEPSPRRAASGESIGSELRATSRSISIQELRQVHPDADEGLSSSLNLPSLPVELSATLGDFQEDSGHNALEDDAPDPSDSRGRRMLASLDGENERKVDNAAGHKSSDVFAQFDEDGGPSSNPSNRKNGAAAPKQSLRFRRNRGQGDGTSSIVYPGQPGSSLEGGSNRRLSFKSDSGRSEWNSFDMENEVQVCYGDMPLPEKYENHILVCVIGQMGMMNLKQFLLRLRAIRRGEHNQHDQQVVAICPVVTEENVQELSELDKLKLCLIQGNSLSINTLRSALYDKARAIVILACEDKGVVNDMDSNAIYTIMTLDHLIPEKANIFVCSMIDSEESMHLLRAPHRVRTRIGDLAVQESEPRGIRRRNSRLSMRNFSAGLSMDSKYDSKYGSIRNARRLSFFELSRVNSFGARSQLAGYSRGGAIRHSKSFVAGGYSRGTPRDERRMPLTSDNLERLQSRTAATSIDYNGFDYLTRHRKYGGAPWLRKMSTATMGKKAWLDGTASNMQATTVPRADPVNYSFVMKKSRDDAFEKERYASGEMMISSMFIALLIREFSMSGLTEVVGKLFGTRLESQPCWVRSFPVPRSWFPTEPDSKGLEYRELCEKLLDHSCIPLGLYRCGAAPVRVWYKLAEDESGLNNAQGGERSLDIGDDEYADEYEHQGRAAGHADLSQVAERVSALSRLRTPSPRGSVGDDIVPGGGEALGTILEEPFLGGMDSNAFHDERLPEELRSPTDGFTTDSALENGSNADAIHTGTYRFVTSDRTVLFHEYPEGLNVLPYVYTNPEPYTIVSEHDAVYVLVNPALSLKNLK